MQSGTGGSVTPATRQRCLQVLRSVIECGERETLPLVWLRPRPIDEQDAFDGDFDFLADLRRFGQILDHLFQACTERGISFTVRQQAPFKRQVELMAHDGARLTLEFWPHAEFRSRPRHGHLSRAAVTYETYAARPAAERQALQAALFILHLHHKQKTLDEGPTPYRLAFFQAQAGTPAVLRQVLERLQSNPMDLEPAHRTALAYLRAHAIPIESPVRIALRRQWKKLRQGLRWRVPGVITIVGPDGSGKSTLIDGLKSSEIGSRFRFQRFKRFFRRPLIHIVTSEPRNVRDEKVLWLILPTAWIFLSLSRWLTGWRRPVILDRYFYDYLVRNMRHPEKPLQRIGAYVPCSRLVPLPRQVIVATCPTAIIRARKREMTETSMQRLYAVYLDQIARFGPPEALFCHTATAPETACRQAMCFILGTDAPGAPHDVGSPVIANQPGACAHQQRNVPDGLWR